MADFFLALKMPMNIKFKDEVKTIKLQKISKSYLIWASFFKLIMKYMKSEHKNIGMTVSKDIEINFA